MGMTPSSEPWVIRSPLRETVDAIDRWNSKVMQKYRTHLYEQERKI